MLQTEIMQIFPLLLGQILTTLQFKKVKAKSRKLKAFTKKVVIN